MTKFQSRVSGRATNSTTPISRAEKLISGCSPPKFHQIMETYGFKDYHGIGDVIGWSQGA